MTISPSLNSQFNVLVNGGGDEHHPVYSVDGGAGDHSEGGEGGSAQSASSEYRGAGWGDIQLLCALLVWPEAMLYGAIVTFMGWTLYGLVSPRFELKNKHS